MHKALSNKPGVEAEKMLWRLRDWKELLLGPGNDRIVVEWCVTAGPKVFVYPPARRSVGFDLCAGSGDGNSDERWADFLEFEFVPGVEKALAEAGYKPQVICADQRPIQAMRQRRRATEALAAERSGKHH
jgi:hypothetical protein